MYFMLERAGGKKKGELKAACRTFNLRVWNEMAVITKYLSILLANIFDMHANT